MSLVRAIPIKDFRSAANALSTTAVGTGTAFSTQPPDAGEALYAALHLTGVSSEDAADRSLVMTVQAASSSGFSPLTTEITFSLTSARGSTWQRLASPSTDHPWRRANWTISTVGSTEGDYAGLVWIGFK
jgi:hypothetical protein